MTTVRLWRYWYPLSTIWQQGDSSSQAVSLPTLAILRKEANSLRHTIRFPPLRVNYGSVAGDMYSRPLHCLTAGTVGKEDHNNTEIYGMKAVSDSDDTRGLLHGVTARVWCRGRIDRKRNSTINLTTDSGACY